MSAALDAFERGDYLFAAQHLSPDTWQHWASLGLIGHHVDAAAALERFSDAGALFFRGVASWIAGDDDRALHLLERCQDDHARRLVALIRRRPINVLAQLPWNRGGAWDILTNLRDPSFRLFNISFHPDDIPNRPYADIHSLVPKHAPPDMFVAEMLEWHLLPPNVRELGCPVIGHSSDFDLHIQAVAPWLALFDELVVLDSVEWRAMSGLVSVPVSVFPKVFGVPSQVPEPAEGERDVDVFLSGTVTHPYHIDKEPVLLDALSMPRIRLRLVNGFDTADSYYLNLARAKLCCTFIRHPGAMPTRGLEALAMGCAVAVQEESALRVFTGDAAGVVTYRTEPGNLAETIAKVLARWDMFRAQARTGAEIVRREFALHRVASQYFRFLTVLATRPRVARPGPAPGEMVQKRSVVQKGWIPSYAFGTGLLMEWAAQSDARLERLGRDLPSSRLLNDVARERLLFHYHDLCVGRPHLIEGVIAPLERAIDLFPSALVPRFNLARILLHFGSPTMVRRGVALIDDVLRQPADRWHVDPLDDVLPWDFCPEFFNYRRYFDTLVRVMASGRETSTSELIDIICASLCYYRAKYTHELPSDRSDVELAGEAVRLDPVFADYVLYWSRLLVTRAWPGDLEEAAAQLQQLSRRSARLLEILDLARHLPPAMQGEWHQALEDRTARLWSAVEMRENHRRPVLRSSADACFRGARDPLPIMTATDRI